MRPIRGAILQDMKSKPSPGLALRLLGAPALLLPAVSLLAQSAPSIAAGGLEPNSDPRITVARELVHISDRKIAVEYDLANNSGADITTDLGFTVPPYKNQWNLLDPALQSFRSLRVWADGEPVEYRTDTKASLNGVDITKTLEKARIDIATFGHMNLGRDQRGTTRTVLVADYERLPQKEKHRLRGEGIFKGEEGFSLYTVNMRYHWPQTIAAHSTAHIREEYVPVVGFTEAPPQADVFQAALTPVAAATGGAAGQSRSEASQLLGGFCADAKFIHSMMDAHKYFAQNWGGSIVPHWVDFSLQADAGWRRPIDDFTLVVDVPEPADGQHTLISFCAPGVLEKLDSGHPQIHLTKYVPGTGLHIGFFNAPVESAESPIAAK